MRTKTQDILDNITKDYHTMQMAPDRLMVYPWYHFGMGISCHLSLQFRYLKERVYENLTKIGNLMVLKLGFNWFTTQGPHVETPIQIMLIIEDYANLIIQPKTDGHHHINVSEF